MNTEEYSRRIADYKLENGIDVITEEEYLDIIPESEPYLYTGDFIDQTCDSTTFFHEDVDEIMPYEVSGEFCWCPNTFTFEEALHAAVIMDKLFLIRDDTIVDYGICDVGDDFNEFLIIRGLLDNYEYMKIEEPGIDEGEWERALADDLAYYATLRTKIVDVDVADMNALEQFLKGDINETIFRIKIHMEVDGKRFLIRLTVDEQYVIYRVFHELDNAGTVNLKSLGWDTWPESALQIIDYYLETGLTLEHYQ